MPVRWERILPNDDLKANPDIFVTDELDSADAAVISDGLRAYYLSQTGYYDFRPLAVFVRDPQTGKIIGGLPDGPNSGSSMSPGSFCQKIGAAHGLAAAYWRWQKRKADDAAAPGSR